MKKIETKKEIIYTCDGYLNLHLWTMLMNISPKKI